MQGNASHYTLMPWQSIEQLARLKLPAVCTSIRRAAANSSPIAAPSGSNEVLLKIVGRTDEKLQREVQGKRMKDETKQCCCS
jgi:hypothetical protein